MIRITPKQFQALRSTDPLVFAYIFPAARQDGKVVEVDLTKIATGPLRDDARERFLAWSRENHEYDGCNECFNKRCREDAAKQRELNDKIEALNERVRHWIAQGMVNSPANAKTLLDLVDNHPQFKYVQMTPQLLDVAIGILRNEGKLEWRKPEPTPAPTPQPVPAQPVILSDGSEQLPIDAPLSTRYTVEQLKDLDRRKRARAAGESESLPPLPSGRPRLPFGTKPNAAKHADDQIRDLESRTARVWARQTGSHGASWFSSDSQVI